MAKFLKQLELRFSDGLRDRANQAPAAGKVSSKDAAEDVEMTAWCREQAHAMALPELEKKVRVIWNPRMRTTAGRAWWPHCQIELNPKLRDFPEAEAWRTLKHEMAHLVAYGRCGRRRIQPHGPEWQAACAELGIAGESVRHSLPFKGRKMQRKHLYRCPACDREIARVRPFRRAVACHECCREHNSGIYHDRFRLVKTRLGAQGERQSS